MRFNYTLSIILMVLFSSHLLAQNSTKGNWEGPYSTDIVPTAIANLPNGNILMWSSESKLTFTGLEGRTYTSIFNPSTKTYTTTLVTNTGHDMFCPGTTNLPDGRIMVTGGSNSQKASIYNPFTNQWTSTQDMNVPRGYHSQVTMNSGATFTLGGSWSGGLGGKNAEIWTPETGWYALTGVTSDATVRDGAPDPQGVYRDDNHAWFFAAPNGKIFHAGPANKMHWIDTKGIGEVKSAGTRGNDNYAMNGRAVMYNKGKILTAGGAQSYDTGLPASKRSYVIDISDPNSDNVTVTRTGDMNFARCMHHMVPLPNGEVLVFGGLTTSKTFSDDGAILPAEIWNPNTNQWRVVDAMQVPRTYHSSGILMPNGAVFSGGGGLCGGCDVNHPDVELYNPPYLFNSNNTLASRPTINSSPSTASYNANISVSTNSSISAFSLIRFGSDTHSVNNEQRRVPLSFTSLGGNNYRVKMPDRKYAPPGYYMMFAMNGAGVPSVAKVIRIGSAQTPDQAIRDLLAIEGYGILGSSIVNGRGGSGWSGNWQRINSNGPFGVVDENLSYVGYPSGGYAIKIDPISNISMVGQRFIQNPVNSGTVWMSYLVSADKIGVGHVFVSPNGNFDAAVGKRWGNQFAINNNSSSKRLTQTNRTYLVVAKYQLNPNGTDAVYMWVDPDLSSEPSNSSADISAVANISSIDRIYLNVSGWGQGTYLLDEIRLGRTWNSIIQKGGSSANTSCSFSMSENFNFPSGSAINPSGGGTGWSTNWINGQGYEQTRFENGSLNFPGVSSSGNKLRFDMNNSSIAEMSRFNSKELTENGTMWVSMLLKSNDVEYGGIWLRPNNRQDIAIGKRWVNTFGIDNNSGNMPSLVNGQTYRLIARYQFNSNNTEIKLWVLPPSSSFNINSPNATKTVGAINTLSYFTIKAEKGRGDYEIDELYVSCKAPSDLGANIRGAQFAHDLEVQPKPGRRAGLTWVVDQSKPVSRFVVQHGTEEDPSYSDVEEVSSNNSNDYASYTYTHLSPGIGTLNFYRIKIEYTNGDIEYTSSRKIFFDSSAPPISVYPNPTRGDIFIDLKNYNGVEISYFISDLSGKVLMEGTFNQNHLTNEKIELQDLKNGMYFIYLNPTGFKPVVQKILIEDGF